MSLKQFGLDTLATMDDGKLAETFRRHIENVARDCDDRPGDKTARTITITIKIKPKTDPQGVSDKAGADIKMKSSVPDYTFATQSLGVRSNMFVYNEDSPYNVKQGSFLPGEES